MSEQHSDHFDLAEFVLGYLEDQGSIVAPPAFGVHDVLMPDALANRLGLEDYQRVTFPSANEEHAGDALHLNINHPLVETIAQLVVAQPANARAYINGVRLDKHGLAELAQRTITCPNGRLDAVPGAIECSLLHYYVVFNFKVTFASEERQEQLVTVVLDLQAGHAVNDAAILRRLEVVDTESEFADFPEAPLRWLDGDELLSSESLKALMPRAEAALRSDLAQETTALTARMNRHLALELARIEDYYDELASDLNRRQGRAARDEERIKSLDDKLRALTVERTAKLQDVSDRYAVRVELQLINVLLVGQPKVTLPISISNRTAAITRTVVWDPLVHRLEPLVCDVCGQPGVGLHLCTGGHLAHANCLAPQCIDCKREFCQICATQITTCVVCQRPICKPSVIVCPTCGRGTCRAHQKLCHAANGEPAVIEQPAASGSPPIPPVTTPKNAPKTADKTSQPSRAKATTRETSSSARKPLPASTVPVVKAVRIDVEIHETEPVIVAFVMRSTRGVLATRSLELTPQGILVRCQCEKQKACPADNYYHRPLPAIAIQDQIEKLLLRLQKEYLVPTKKVYYATIYGGRVSEEKRLVLPALWFDPLKISEAARGFDHMVGD